MTAIRKNLKNFIAVIVLMAISAGVAGYILNNQRMRFPWEGKPFELRFELGTAQAVTPGQGQTVRVSGVRVGDISKIDLKDGRAIVTTQLDPEFKHLVRTDATALLRPKTGLKDMFIELDPGSTRAPMAKDGWTVPIGNTLPDINPDEVFSALDADTRDYLKLLVQGAGAGLAKRGNDLQEVFARFEPTHRDLARVASKVAERHENLRRLIHSLNSLNGELAGKGNELAQLVDASSSVFRAFASEQGNITRAVGDLPGALRQTTQTLGKVQQLAEALRPAAEHLRPAARALDPANKAVQPFAKEAAPILATSVRPFVRDTRPVARSLKPASEHLAQGTPDLTRSFTVLNHLFNLLAYNPGGANPPSDAKRNEGYLFWVAWLQHNAAAIFSASDANGPFRPVTLGGECGTLKQTVDTIPPLAMVLGPALFDPNVCGS
jgi:phospholipid/cholesterol/gamma-HCH transport system substrate-binding protein